MSERRLKGRYELRSILGRGLATTTHLALDHETGERCVVKRLSLASADALKAHELLMREARVLQRLDHPRIPRLVDYFTEEDGPETRVCLVQQHVDGKSLLELVRAGRRFSEPEAIALGVKLARVLEYLHGFDPPILHRDLKPANVLVTPGERVYLVDFGAVRDHVAHELLHPSGPTIVGTRGYMPIEQFEGHAVPGSDLYALGATLVFALCGKEPGELGKQGLRLDFQPHVSVSPGFTGLLARLLEPDWRDRPMSATQTRQELERLAQAVSRPRLRPRPTLAWVLALAALVAAAGLGIAVMSSGRPSRTHSTGGGSSVRTSERGARSEWAKEPSSPRDAFGDPLPEQALQRLGTVRLRHGGAVNALAFTPDGASILSASADGTASLWSAATGEEKHRFELGVPAVSLAIAPDGVRALVGGGTPFTVWLLDLASGRRLARLLPAPPGPHTPSDVSELAWTGAPQLLATRTHQGVDLWSPLDGRHVRRLASCGAGRSLASLDRGRALLVDCRDGVVRVLDVASGAERRRLTLESRYLPLRVSPDERWIAAASHSRVRLLDFATGTETAVLGGPALGAGSVASLDFARDGRTLAIGTDSGKVVVFDMATRAPRRVLEAQSGSVLAVALSPDGRTLAAGAASHTLRLFDVATGEERAAAPTAHAASVSALDFSRDGETLLSASGDATLRQWDSTGRPGSVRSLDRPIAAVVSLWAPRVVVVEMGRAHVYDLASGWEVSSAPLPDFSSRAGIAVAPNTGLLAVGGTSSLRIVDLTTGDLRSFPLASREEVLALSSDGRVVATLRDEPGPFVGRPLVLRDTGTGRELRALTHNRGGPEPFACRSADGSYFGWNAALYRLDSEAKSRFEPHGYPGRASVCAVSPDGRFVAGRTDEPDTIEVRERVTDVARPELRYVTTLRGHRGPVTSLVFAPDSRTLASGGADTSVLVWDVAGPSPHAEAPPPRESRRDPVFRLAFDDAIEGAGVTPVRIPAESPLEFVPGRRGRALRLPVGLAFPETRELVLSDAFTVSVAFQMGADGLRPSTPNQSVLSSELVTLDVREGGRAHLFLHFLRQGGHSSVDLERFIGKVEPGRWYHVAVSSRRTDGVVRVCVDGVCDAGPAGQRYADRVGLLALARHAPWEPFAGAVDELAVFDRALSDDEMAALAGLPRSVALTVPPPSPTATPRAPQLVEQEPLPREGLPEGKDVASHVNVEERAGFTVYRFGGPLAQAQTLDVDVGLGDVWLGTSLGLLRHDPRTGSWRQWHEASGLPGARLNEIAIVSGRVVVDSSTPTTPGNVRGTGVLAFDVASSAWTEVKELGRVWDLWGDGATLWVGRDDGAEALDLATGERRRFASTAGELVHGTVHAVRRHGETVAFAALGDWVEDKKDFAGGGVTLWDRRSNRFRSYRVVDGLARGYSSDVFLDDDEVFVAHWDEERGLSRIDRRTGLVEVLRQSANGIALGGVVLAGDPEALWIGQQGALVRLDRRSRQATALRERDGLPGYIVSGIAMDEDAVWASVYAYAQDGVRSAGLVRFPRR